MLAKAGILVSVSAIPALAFQGYFLWPIWTRWFFSDRISYLTWHMLNDGPTIVIVTFGLTLYLIGRGVFWKKLGTAGNNTMLALGLIIFLSGGWWHLWHLDGVGDMVDRPMFLSYPMNPGEPWASMLGITWSSILIITGAFIFFDWLYLFHPLEKIGIEIAFASFIAFDDVSLLRVTMGGGTLQRYYHYFLSYTTHQIVVTTLLFAIIAGSILFLYSRRKEVKSLLDFLLNRWSR
jgi:hypothetical protein